MLRPGKYRLNPYAYTWKLEDAVEVGAGEVGVLTLKVGDDPTKLKPDPKRGPYVVPEGYRGVQEKPLSSGTYYVNPYRQNHRSRSIHAAIRRSSRTSNFPQKTASTSSRISW